MRRITFTQETSQPKDSFQRIKRRAQRFDSSFWKGVGVIPAAKNGNALSQERGGHSRFIELKRITFSVK